MKNRFSMFGTALLTAVMLLAAFQIIVSNDDDASVSAQLSPSSDDAGYTWIDNRDPTPKVEYDWMDISSTGTSVKDDLTYYYSYYDIYYRQPTSPQTLPFTFEFYGTEYNEILIWPTGMASFKNTDRGYSYGNYGGPLPNTYTYTPKATIAALWTYGGMPADDSSDILTYSGQTQEGMNYYAISWINIQNPYYSDTRTDPYTTVQAILYENGDIKVNIKDGSLTYDNYATVGICNEERDVGITYSYEDFTKIDDERGVLFKQFKTEIRDVEWADGYGEDKDIYPAMAGQMETDYFAKVPVWSELGIEYVTRLDMIIGSEQGGANVVLRYDFDTDSFKKIQDSMRMVVLNEEFCRATPVSTDPDHMALVEYHFDFNFNWQSIDYTSILFKVYGDGVKGTTRLYESQFRVVSHVKIEGNLTVEDSGGREITSGDWVRGGDTIHFSGMKRYYADDAIPIQPPDMIEIGIKDSQGVTYFAEGTADLDTYVYIDPLYSEIEFTLTFENVTSESDMSDKSNIKSLYDTPGFLVQVDSDNPGLPSQLQVLPDEKNDPPRNYDDDYEVFIVWDDAVDQSSGVARYYFSVNRNKDQATPSDITSVAKKTGENVALVGNLPEGKNKIYLWAEDEVGNQGNEIFTEVTIDFSGVEFGGFYPHIGVWNTQIRPTCSIFVNDTLTGVDPLSIEYEISTTGENGLTGSWQNIPDTYAPAQSLRVVVAGWFKNGKDNWIRFRAQDLAGNQPTTSRGFNVWVDAESPTYDSNYNEDEFKFSPYQEVSINVEDDESGVDASTIEYRLTTRGQTKWTPWKAYKEGSDGKSVEVVIDGTFRRGADNYVQVRAKDLAGNPISYSRPFNIRINTYPTIVITEPSSGDILYSDMEIIFDATETFDLDGDLMTFTWLFSSSTSDQQVEFGTAPRVKTQLKRGEYTITLKVQDRANNEVQSVFVIEVTDRPDADGGGGLDTDDSDLDGMQNWYEDRYKLDKLVKDANEDPDGDGYTNIQEFGNGRWYAENLTNPKDPRSHPVDQFVEPEEEDTSPFASNMLPLWGILVLLIIVVLITMMVVKGKKDKQVKRIKTVRNMRKIMPSVSWDHITTTAYMAPYTQGPALAAASGPALPSGQPHQEVDQSSALPPAQQVEGAQSHEQAQTVQQGDASQAQGQQQGQPGAPVEPQPAQPQPQPAPTEPQPAPQPEQQPAQNQQQPDYQPPQ